MTNIREKKPGRRRKYRKCFSAKEGAVDRVKVRYNPRRRSE